MSAIPNIPLRDWQRYVKLWLNQPAKKQKRRQARLDRARRVAPRPIDLLRPIVRGQTNKYNTKVRFGRGFTLDELRAAGIKRREAAGVGITTDHRRRNRSTQSLDVNVARLRLYKSKLVVFPRNPTSQKTKAGDSTKEQKAKVVADQNLEHNVLPITVVEPRVKARKITDADRSFEASKTVRKARMDEKLWGRREKRAKDKKEGKSAKSKKGGDEEPMDE